MTNKNILNMAGRRLALLLTLFSALLPLGAQTQLSPYKPGVTPEGAVYFLPRTSIQVRVLVEKTTYQPGDFCRYAARFLRQNDVGQEPSVAYRIIDIRQFAVPVADTTKVYAVKFNARSSASNMILASDGRLLAINNDDAEDLQLPALFQPAPKPAPVNPRQFMNQEILACSSMAKMAELTAHEIYDLRENRSLLIKGQAEFMPKDGQQMQLMLAQIEQQDQALTSLFTGTTVCDTTEHILTVNPGGSFPRQLLFRLSQIRGLVDTDDLSGAPYYVSIEDLKTVPPVDGQAAAKAKKHQYEAGIYVNIPGQMRSVIYEGITPINTADLPAPQFGNVELLSAELFNKRYTTHLLLSPRTGAIERLEADQQK